MLSNTAILIFSRLPQEEVLHKKISENKEASLSLWQGLYNKTLHAAKSTGLPIIACSEADQVGNSFAEKITNAITASFNVGYSKLIVLGADCGQLSPTHLKQAVTLLQNGSEIVCGRDLRGGIYLLGINKEAFKNDNFLAFNWQTNKLFKDISTYAEDFSFAKLASVLKDVNTTKDVATLLSYVTIQTDVKVLLQRISQTIIQKTYSFSERFTSLIFTSHSILRGPPSMM